MRTERKNKKFNVLGLTDDGQMVEQETLTIQEHEVQTKYLMLADNQFKGFSPVLCPGYFNRKTQFLIGEVNSLIAIDSQLNRIDGNTSDLINADAYLLYPVPCLTMEFNKTLEYFNEDSVTDIDLSYDFGQSIGSFLAGKTDIEELIDLSHEGFIRLFIDTRRGVSLNKNVLLNSNYKFVLGILNGYYLANGEKAIHINSNVNIYTFTVILNYLGASYSIRNSRDHRKKMFIQLPDRFEKYIESLFIKPRSFKVIHGELELVSKHRNYDAPEGLAADINSGKIIAIPTSSILFETLDKDAVDRMYDLTSERHDATNYAMPMTPLLKNSDGDILAASGIFTKEGLEDAKAFSPEDKVYYKKINDGSINQWIAGDAIVGLYNATSAQKK